RSSMNASFSEDADSAPAGAKRRALPLSHETSFAHRDGHDAHHDWLERLCRRARQHVSVFVPVPRADGVGDLRDPSKTVIASRSFRPALLRAIAAQSRRVRILSARVFRTV